MNLTTGFQRHTPFDQEVRGIAQDWDAQQAELRESAAERRVMLSLIGEAEAAMAASPEPDGAEAGLLQQTRLMAMGGLGAGAAGMKVPATMPSPMASIQLAAQRGLQRLDRAIEKADPRLAHELEQQKLKAWLSAEESQKTEKLKDKSKGMMERVTKMVTEGMEKPGFWDRTIAQGKEMWGSTKGWAKKTWGGMKEDFSAFLQDLDQLRRGESRADATGADRLQLWEDAALLRASAGMMPDEPSPEQLKAGLTEMRPSLERVTATLDDIAAGRRLTHGEEVAALKGLQKDAREKLIQERPDLAPLVQSLEVAAGERPAPTPEPGREMAAEAPRPAAEAALREPAPAPAPAPRPRPRRPEDALTP